MAMVSFPKVSNTADKTDGFRPETGVGFRFVGGAIIQDSTRTQFLPTLEIGCETDLDIWSIEMNRIGIGIGYLYYFGSLKAGTEQINTLSSRQQIDFTVNYKYHWTYLGIFVGIGASMGIFSVTMRMYDLGVPSVAHNGETYIFNNKTLIEEEKSTGTIFGPTAIIGSEFDLGSTLFRRWPGMDNLWFLNLAVQYVIRDLQNELNFFAIVKVTIRKMSHKSK
jgi:hypothetical protein